MGKFPSSRLNVQEFRLNLQARNETKSNDSFAVDVLPSTPEMTPENVSKKRPFVLLTKDKFIDSLALRMCNIHRNTFSAPVSGSAGNTESTQCYHVPKRMKVAAPYCKLDGTLTKVSNDRIRDGRSQNPSKSSNITSSDVQDTFLNFKEQAGFGNCGRNVLKSPYLENRSSALRCPIYDVTNLTASKVERDKTTVGNQPASKSPFSKLPLSCGLDARASRHGIHKLTSTKCKTTVPKSNLAKIDDLGRKTASPCTAFDGGGSLNMAIAAEPDCLQRSDTRWLSQEPLESTHTRRLSDGELLSSVLGSQCPIVVVERCLSKTKNSEFNKNKSTVSNLGKKTASRCTTSSDDRSIQNKSTAAEPNCLQRSDIRWPSQEPLESTHTRRLSDGELLSSVLGSQCPIVVVERCSLSKTKNSEFNKNKSTVSNLGKKTASRCTTSSDDRSIQNESTAAEPNCLQRSDIRWPSQEPMESTNSSGPASNDAFVSVLGSKFPVAPKDLTDHQPLATANCLTPTENIVSSSLQNSLFQSVVVKPATTQPNCTIMDTKHVRVSMDISKIIGTGCESSGDELYESMFGSNYHQEAGNQDFSITRPNKVQCNKTSKRGQKRIIGGMYLYSSDECSSDENFSDADPLYEPSVYHRLKTRKSSKNSFRRRTSRNSSIRRLKRRAKKSTFTGESTPSAPVLSRNKKLNSSDGGECFSRNTGSSSTNQVKKVKVQAHKSRSSLKSTPAADEAKCLLVRSLSTTKELPRRRPEFGTPLNSSTSSSSKTKPKCNNRSQTFSDSRLSTRFQTAMKRVWSEFETTHENTNLDESETKSRNSWPAWSPEQLSKFMEIQSRVNSMMPHYFSSSPSRCVDLETLTAALTKQ
ncbi:hypothetical protein GE061_018247 [Apolygus lucorum]|uniref:Uncharacterized protein n=1 Tax=Apolygus lucorum TaxID=248454 RepID=A0A8S9XEP2_APOLU|nr:hypothetical protein GE061_018247 [Apolygus lucorum]